MVCKVGISRHKLRGFEVELILIPHETGIHRHAYLLTCACISKINTDGTFPVIHRHMQSDMSTDLSPNVHTPSCGWMGDTVSSCFKCHKVSFLWSIQCHVFHLFVLLLVALLFKIGPKCSVDVWPTAPRPNKAVMLLPENPCVLGELHPGWLTAGAGHALDVNKSAIYIKHGVF